jgi:hypothetical protein
MSTPNAGYWQQDDFSTTRDEEEEEDDLSVPRKCVCVCVTVK